MQRQENLGCYGYDRNTSPQIDKLAKDGIIFKNMLANTSWTRPGTASILTGLYPQNHGAIATKDNLAAEINLISEILGGHGYTSNAFVANHHVGEKVGFNQGYKNFISFTESKTENYLKFNVSSDEVNTHVLEAINKLEDKSNNFIYIHYIDPHAPYTAKEKHFSKSNEIIFSQDKFKSLVQPPENPNLLKKVITEMTNAYDDEILFTDKMIGRLVNALKNKNMFNNSIIIITSDHGEEFYEHGTNSHGKTLYDEQLRVPLIIRLPDNTPKTINHIANQIDILPTTLSLLDIPIPAKIDGIDLLDSKTPARKYSFAELSTNHSVFSSVQTTEDKLIEEIIENKPRINSPWFKKAALIKTRENSLDLIIRSFNNKCLIQILCDWKQIRKAEITPRKRLISFPLPHSDKNKSIIIRSLTPCQIPSKLNINKGTKPFGFQIIKSKNINGENILGEPINEYYYLSKDKLEKHNQFTNIGFEGKIRQLINKLLKYKYDKWNLKLTMKPVLFDKKRIQALKELGYF